MIGVSLMINDWSLHLPDITSSYECDGAWSYRNAMQSAMGNLQNSRIFLHANLQKKDIDIDTNVRAYSTVILHVGFGNVQHTQRTHIGESNSPI